MEPIQPYRKFIDKFDVDDWEIKTDNGYKPIKAIGKTVPYEVWEVKTERGRTLRCADTHILFDTEFDGVFAKDLNKDSRPDYIQTESGVELVASVKNTGVSENMYDIEVDDDFHRYYTNGFLSHNSIFLCNDAVNFVKSGKNVLFITCEMSAKKVIKRMGANMLDINIDMYDRESVDIDKMSKRISELRQKQILPMGKLFIREYPTSCCTTIDVENYIKHIQEVEGFKVHVVVIDYINIMANYRNINSEDLYNKIKQISEDLRAIAVKQECLIVTATQSNRGAFDSDDITMSGIAESAGLIHTADTIYGIIQNQDMRINGTYNLKILKIRDGMGKNDRMEMSIDYRKMRIDETGMVLKEGADVMVPLADATPRYGNIHQSTPQENIERALGGLGINKNFDAFSPTQIPQ